MHLKLDPVAAAGRKVLTEQNILEDHNSIESETREIYQGVPEEAIVDAWHYVPTISREGEWILSEVDLGEPD